MNRRPFKHWKLTVFGIPVRIDRSWFAVLAFVSWSLASDYFPSSTPGLQGAVYWGMGLTAATLLFTCVLLHEFGHSLVARRYGIGVSQVTLFMFGGVAELAGRLRRPSMELMITLAGPLVSAIIAGGCVGAWRLLVRLMPSHIVLIALVRYLAFMNIALIAFNLLPGFPLDGGRIFRAVVWGITGNLAGATRLASAIGSMLGLGLIGLGVWSMVRGAGFHGLWYVLLGIFLRNAANSYRVPGRSRP